jgi:DNA integrity scanning protein DisA with diadenylate cyclase activity
MFICQKVNARKCFNLVGIEVFSKLFYLMCDLFKSDKKISKIKGFSSVTRYILLVFYHFVKVLYWVKKLGHEIIIAIVVVVTNRRFRLMLETTESI